MLKLTVLLEFSCTKIELSENQSIILDNDHTDFTARYVAKLKFTVLYFGLNGPKFTLCINITLL